MDTLAKHRTRAGIDCVKNNFWASIKIFGGCSANLYREKTGGTSGWFERSSEQREADRAEGVFKGVHDRWKREYTGSAKSFGFWLIHRSRFCWSIEDGGKDELKRYRENVVALYDLVDLHRRTGKPLENYHIYEAQDRLLTRELNGVPGVYLRQHFNHPEEIYIGSAKDIGKRSHSNASHRLVQAWPTVDAKAARDLETNLHGSLLASGEVKYSPTEKGLFILQDGNGVTIVNQLMKDHHRSFCRDTVEGFGFRIEET